MEIKGIHVLAAFVIGLVLYGMYQSGYLNQLTGGQVSQWFLQPTEKPTEQPSQPQTPTTIPQVTECPTKGMTAPDLKLTIIDALNPKQGISGLRVEALPADETPWDPYRTVLDYGDTDSDGVVTFSGGVLKIGEEYKFVLRGDNTVYDKVVTMKTPCIPGDFVNKPYSFPERIKTYQVGSFSDISTDADNTLTCSDISTLNVTANTGIQQIQFDITIAEDVPGKALKEPVIVFRSPEGYELEDGDILHIYAIRKSGSELGIPPGDLQGYLTGGTPIPLTTRTQITEGDEVKYIMTSADSATYTIIIQYDADNINPSDDKLQIVLDDLGDYNGKDVATRSTKASPQTLTIEWCQ